MAYYHNQPIFLGSGMPLSELKAMLVTQPSWMLDILMNVGRVHPSAKPLPSLINTL